MPLDYKKIIPFLFPPSDDELVLNACTPADFVKKVSPLQVCNCTALLPFADPVVKAAIHLNKYHFHGYAQTVLAAALTAYLRTEPHKSTMLPVPLSAARFRVRGYNQTEEIALRTTRTLPQVTLDTKSLVRIRNTQPQTTLNKQNRLKNMHGAFSVKKKYADSLANKHVLLIDDVLTTGATLAAAKDALAIHSPARITCIALAH